MISSPTGDQLKEVYDWASNETKSGERTDMCYLFIVYAMDIINNFIRIISIFTPN